MISKYKFILYFLVIISMFNFRLIKHNFKPIYNMSLNLVYKISTSNVENMSNLSQFNRQEKNLFEQNKSSNVGPRYLRPITLSFKPSYNLQNLNNNKSTSNLENMSNPPQKISEQTETSNESILKQEAGCMSWKNMYEINLSTLDDKTHPDSMLFNQDRIVKDVNCRLLFDDNIIEQAKAFQRMQHPLINMLATFNLNVNTNCDKYIRETGYITSSLTEEEEQFPIAYSILVYKDIQQVEMLLRSIYRPQNVYCIHCDENADHNFKLALNTIVGCFKNVFMASTSYKVEWGKIEVLLPEISCMRNLLKYTNWKYFINLTGQEFPLRTNYELVKILKAYNGSNNLEGTLKRANLKRWPSQTKPPHNITLVKGSVHIVVNRDFVSFVIQSYISEDFLEWIHVNNIDVPDETFFATLNYNPHLQIPGSYEGNPETDCEKNPFLTRFKNWGDHVFNWPCKGKRVREICIFGIEDLPLLMSRQELFANKFHFEYQPYTYQCMDELLFNRTRDEYYNILQFDTNMYQSLGFIKNKV